MMKFEKNINIWTLWKQVCPTRHPVADKLYIISKVFQCDSKEECMRFLKLVLFFQYLLRHESYSVFCEVRFVRISWKKKLKKKVFLKNEKNALKIKILSWKLVYNLDMTYILTYLKISKIGGGRLFCVAIWYGMTHRVSPV